MKFLKKFENWIARQPRNRRILIIIVSLAWMLLMSYGALSTRIQKTGWEHFPTTLLDWFAIIGSAGFLVLIINGIVGLVSVLKK